MKLYIERVGNTAYYDLICNGLATTCRYDDVDTGLSLVMRPYLRRNLKAVRVTRWQAPLLWVKP